MVFSHPARPPSGAAPKVSPVADAPELRKARGAYFTPPAIADFLARWAIGGNPEARVLDPSCGEAAFLVAAGAHLRELGAAAPDPGRLVGVDVHEGSLDAAGRELAAHGLRARLVAADVFELVPPGRPGAPLPAMDAVVGNPPFIRYQRHAGAARARARAAALAQGVTLSGLASSWAAVLVHACAFLRPEGRLAMVLPAELLTVGYAEPVRQWLRRRFARVSLVLVERRQFRDAQEKVVLLMAEGDGGCDAFALRPVGDARELDDLPADGAPAVAPAAAGKWTGMLLPPRARELLGRVMGGRFVPLGEYGPPELGTVTGANRFFALSEEIRRRFGLAESQLARISPPGTRHLRGLAFDAGDWSALRDAGAPVWLLHPDPADRAPGLRRYLAHGEALGVPAAYKCRVRTPWWRPPLVPVPDLFFTYMSHRHPRLVENRAGVSLVNSMHGVRLRPGAPPSARAALPALALGAVTTLGAELHGRAYGGGVLKMEPREAATLPVPAPPVLEDAWALLRRERGRLDRALRDGEWAAVAERVDAVLLSRVCGLRDEEVAVLREAAAGLRARRLGRGPSPA